MRKGIFIVNQYIKSSKFHEMYDMFMAASGRVGCELKMLTNAEAWFSLLSADSTDRFAGADFVLFWDKDILLARFLENRHLKVYNSAAAIEKCDDKGLTFAELYAGGIRMPKTFPAPKIFREIEEDFCYFDGVAAELGFPLIIKENHGSFGFQVYLLEGLESYRDTIRRMGSKPFLVQEYISASRGRDIRVQVAGRETVAAVQRINPDDFRANATSGGKMYPYQPSGAEREMALKACEILGLDFAGVDILFGADGEPVLCEVNSNAHLVNLYHCTHINAAEKILEFINSN